MILHPPDIEKLLRQHLAQKNVHWTPAQVKIESQFLQHSANAALEDVFDAALGYEGFSPEHAELMMKSPKAISTLTYEDLLSALASPGQTLITLRPHKKHDVLWQGKGTGGEWRGFVRPFPVNAGALAIRRRQIHYAVTRNEILTWDRAATKIPTSSMEAFMRFMKNHKHRIRAVVADKDGVMVIFNVVAHDYLSWRKSTITLWALLTKNGVNADRFKLGRLVPISRESRGRGALVFMA